MAAKSRTLPLSQRGLNFEMAMWFFTRLTALAMYAFILFGMIGALVMGARTGMNFADFMRWAFTPTVTHVQNTNVPELAPWSSAFWRAVGSLLLLIATAHGVHGLVVVADDYISSPRGRQVVRIVSVAFMLVMMAIGVYVLWTD